MNDPEPIRHWRFQGNEMKYIRETMELGFGATPTGTMKERFEKAVRERFGVQYVITSNSGTSPLHQALMAFGVKPGDEVILSPLGPVMPAFTVIQAGAKPVFADVDPKTFLIDPADIRRKITPRTKAIMPVHLYGAVCDMPAIMEIAKEHDLFVIEDSAQCILGTDSQGRIAGTIGHAGSFSFDSVKHIASGEGGMLMSNDYDIAERARRFGAVGFKSVTAETGNARRHKNDFQDPTYERHTTFGYNYRMAELLAAVALAQIERVDAIVEKREAMAQQFHAVLKKTACDWLVPQMTYGNDRHSYWTFVAKYDGEERFGVSWREFRQTFMDNGGDGIYASYVLMYDEPIMRMLDESGRAFEDLEPQYPWCKGMLDGVSCPISKELQPKLLQFTTNQQTQDERDKQAAALEKTIVDISSRA